MIYQAIVFLPILGALIAGFFGRFMGPRPAELVTSGFLLVTAVLSWIAFWQVGIGHETTKINLLRWVSARTMKETFSPPRDYRYPYMTEE